MKCSATDTRKTMRPSAVALLIRALLRGKKLRTGAVVGGLAVGMLALGVATVAGLGTTRALQQHLDKLFPEQRIVLRPETVEAFMLQAETTTITPETVTAVKKLPGVERVSPEATVRFPLSAEGSLLGQTYGTDLTVTGIYGWLLGEDKPPQFSYDPQKDDSVPTVLSHYFLELYNTALAESNNLPKFSPDAIIGRDMELKLGESTIYPVAEEGPEPDRKLKTVPAEIVGLTRNPDLLGLLAPLETVESWNEWYGLEDMVYRALHVQMESAEAVENIKPHLADLGLTVHDRMAPWRKALVVVRLVGIAFVGLGVLVFGLALAYLASAITWMLAERHRELALFRALGASPRQVMLLLAVEIGATSFLGIASGLGIGVAALAYANQEYLAWRGPRTFLPEVLFAIPWWWIVTLGLGCWLAALCLSMSQVAASTNVSISTALSKNE